MFSSLMHKRGRRPCSPSRPRARRRPEVEVLEDRMVLSHTLMAPEFIVSPNQFSTSPPAQVAVAEDDTGDFVVVWTQQDQVAGADFPIYDVYARLYNPDGVAQGDPILVADNINDLSYSFSGPSVDVAMDVDGDFVVVYDTGPTRGGFSFGGSDVFAVVFDTTAAGTGASRTLSATAGAPISFRSLDGKGFSYEQPSVTLDNDGNFAVSFTLFDDYGGGSQSPPTLLVRRFDSEGNFLRQDQVDTPATTINGFVSSSITSDGAGNLVVAWNGDDLADYGGSAIFASRVAQGGDPGAPLLVSKNSSSDSEPAVGIGRNGGDFVVTWNQVVFNPDESSTPFILARRFDTTAGDFTAEFTVNSEPITQPDAANAPEVAVDGQGDFVIVWTTASSFSSGVGSEAIPISEVRPVNTQTVYFRAYESDGSPELDPSGMTTGEVKVNTFSQDFGPIDVATDHCGNNVIVWSGTDTRGENQQDVFARLVPGGDCPPEEMMPPDQGTPPDEVPPPEVIPPAVIPPVVPTSVFDPTASTLIALVNSGQNQPALANLLAPFIFTEPAPEEVFPVPAPSAPEPVFLREFIAFSAQEQTRNIGEIGGRVFEDLNGNGIQDPGEPELRDQIVFLDYNDNGIPDEGEPTMKTDAQGRYLFSGLALNRYRVRQLRTARVRQTVPSKDAAYVVELTPKNSSVANKDFGTRILPATGGATQPVPTSAGQNSNPPPEGGNETQSPPSDAPPPPPSPQP
jgi:SdrD B-like domain